MTVTHRSIQSVSVCLTLTLLACSLSGVAQQQPRPTRPSVREGEVENQEITVEKSRRIEFPPANRIINKIPSVKPSAEARKMTYSFEDRNLTVGDPRIQPSVLPVTATQAEVAPAYTNYVKLGAGNYGTFYGEGFVGIHDQPNYGLEGSLRHLSSSIGPVDGRNSAQAETKLNLTGKYLTDAIKLTGAVGYDREQYYFYGYTPLFNANNERIIPDRETIRQRLNTFRLNAGIENQNKESTIDYSLKTGITTLRDYYNAAELDWGTTFNGSVGISDRLVALVGADAYLTQRTDGPVDNRNLFRVRPSFKYTTPLLTVTAGLNAVNETDRRLDINQTRAFPVIDVDVTPAGRIHFFAGVDGDIQRNTLRSLLTENRWLAPQVLLANTVKSLEIYGGSKGEIGSGFSYEGRLSVARYRNFATFNNSWPDTTRFFVLYDGGVSRVVTISGQLGYNQKDKFRSQLRVDAYRYGMDRLEEAWGRPQLAGTWSNSYILNKKLFVTSDLYVYQGIQNKNFVTGEVITLKPIYDLNLKIDYFLGKQVSAFVSLNNIFGRNYERYLYYRVQGLNFLGGISYSF